VIEVAHDSQVPVELAARTYFRMSEALELQWLGAQLNELDVNSYWQALARDSFRDELETQQRLLLSTLLGPAGEAGMNRLDQKMVEQRLEDWQAQNQQHVERWFNVLAELKNAAVQDYAMYTVASRELADLARYSRMAELATA